MPHWLLEAFDSYGDRTAIVWREKEYSYADLLQRITTWQAEFEGLGIEAGHVVAFEGDYSPNVCALFLALVSKLNIAVPLAAGGGESYEKRHEIAQVQSLFMFDGDDKWEHTKREVEAEEHPLLRKLRDQNRPGLVLFSSGSTGESKAIIHDFDAVLSNIRKPRRGWRAMVFLLLDHIGGVNTLMNILRNGGTAVLTEDRRPESICRMIEQHKVELLPTSPTFLNMLLISGEHEKYDLSSLELMTYGTERMATSTLKVLNEVFPNVRFKQTYGMTELGIVPTRSKDTGSLWMKVGGDKVETKVVDNILWLRTESSMLGYLNAPHPFDEDGWFNTQDEVEVDGDYYRILGRTSDIINVGGEKVYPAEVESVLLELDNIKDVSVSSRPNPVTGQIVTAQVCVEKPEKAKDLRRRIHEECAGRLTKNQLPVIVKVVEKLDVNIRYKKVR